MCLPLAAFFDKTGINLKNMFEEKFVDVTTFYSYVVVVFIVSILREFELESNLEHM